MKLSYHLVNVFGRANLPFSGNALCVVEPGPVLDDELMLAIARQFNLSETVFLGPSDVGDAHVRIFTPEGELPFAGHPTLGTAFVVARLKGNGQQTNIDIRLSMRAGIIPVQIRDQLCTLKAGFPATQPLGAGLNVLADALGLPLSSIGSGTPLWVNTGTEQLIVPLKSVQDVRAANPNLELLAALSGVRRRHVYVFAFDDESRVESRFFFSVQGSLREDPATGSACANLGGWWIESGGALPFRCEISQGEQVNRPSTLLLEVDNNQQIFVGGRVCYLGQGELSV